MFSIRVLGFAMLTFVIHHSLAGDAWFTISNHNETKDLMEQPSPSLIHTTDSVSPDEPTQRKSLENTTNSSIVAEQTTTPLQMITNRSIVAEQTTPRRNASSSISPPNKVLCSSTNENYYKRIVVDAEGYAEKISSPIALGVGLAGNTAIVFALRGRPFSAIPSSCILASLAAADSLTLITIQFNKNVVRDLIGHDVRANSREGCKLFFFVVHFAKILSAWFVVLVCFERFVAICFPFHTRTVCTKSNALRAIVVVLVIDVVYSGVWTLSSDVVNSKCNPSFDGQDTQLRGKILIIVGSGLIGIVPMVMLITLTPTMCVVLFKQYIARKKLTSARIPDNLKVSAMLISICVSFIVLQLPLLVAHNVASVRGENVYTTNYLPLNILYKVGGVLEVVNYSSNFFFYVACNRVFRRKAATLCGRRRKSERTITLSTINQFSTTISDQH